MKRRRVLSVVISVALVVGCRRGEDAARANRHTPAPASAEPPPTEAEGVPEIRAVLEKAEREGVHMRFWRLGAGTPGPDGWVAAAPTRGGFEVEFPVRFNDFSQTTTATDGATIEVGSVGGPWEGGKLSCTRMHRLDGSPSPIPTRSMREEWQAKPDTVSARDRTWEGFPAVEVEIKSAKAHAQMLIVDAGPGGSFTVIAELPEAAWAAHRAEVDRFLHSLKTKLVVPAGR